MAYETGTVTGQVNLVDKLDTFIGTLGNWTVYYGGAFAAPDDAADKQLHVSFYDSGESGESNPEDQEVYCTFVSRVNAADPRFRFQPSLAVDNTKNILLQPQSPSATYTPFVSLPPSSSMTYWFFAEDTYLIVVLSISGGWYQSLFFGKLELFDTYKNGYAAIGNCGKNRYADSRSDYDYTVSTSFRASLVGYSGGFVSDGSGFILKNDDTWANIFVSTSLNVSSQFSTQASNYWTGYYTYIRNHLNAIFPIMLSVGIWDETVANTFVPIGYLPSLRYACIDGILANTEITIGADDYLLFPWWTQSTVLGGETYWQNNGYAIKKVV
jgi:hypothetical protein